MRCGCRLARCRSGGSICCRRSARGRSGRASPTHPFVKRRNYEVPHVHLGKGQYFQSEVRPNLTPKKEREKKKSKNFGSRSQSSHLLGQWATGHNTRPAYLTLVKAEDESKLATLQRANLDEYLEQAPADQQGVPDKFYWKYARKPNNTDEPLLDNGDKDGGKDFFARGILPGMDDYEPRPESFQKRFEYDTLMMEFKMEHMSNDRFARYHNDKYPFILQVQRYDLSTFQAHRGDFARVTMPDDAESGSYVLWYLWNGEPYRQMRRFIYSSSRAPRHPSQDTMM